MKTSGYPAPERSVLIILDVDGTISPIHPPGDLLHRYTLHSCLPIDEELVAALDQLTWWPGVSVAWLTSWERDGVRWLIDGPLAGRLDGPYFTPAPAWLTRPAGWRTRTLLQHLDGIRPDAIIWADDDAANDVNRRRLCRAGYRHRNLLIQPDTNIGLTLEDVEAMRTFVDRVSCATRGR